MNNQTVNNYEETEVLEAHRLACCNHTDVDKRHKSAWAGTKDSLLLKAIAITKTTPVPQIQISIGQHKED